MPRRPEKEVQDMTQIVLLFFCVGVELGVLIGFFIAAVIMDKIYNKKGRKERR